MVPKPRKILHGNRNQRQIEDKMQRTTDLVLVKVIAKNQYMIKLHGVGKWYFVFICHPQQVYDV